MDLRVTIQNLDQQIRQLRQQNQLLGLNCAALGTTIAKMRSDILGVIEQLDNPVAIKGVIQVNLRATLSHEPKDIVNTIVQQSMALNQLRALVAQYQTQLDQHEAAAATKV